jgi:hypothetical protein
MINSTDISKIVKRLELIKSLIVLEEEEDIAEQVTKLQQRIPPTNHIQINSE